MNYCANCIRYDYCLAQGICIASSFGYCTKYQPKSVDEEVNENEMGKNAEKTD